MKKALTLILALLVALSLAACGGSTGGTGTGTAPAATGTASQTAASSTAAPAETKSAEPITLKICISETATDVKGKILDEVTANITKQTEGRINFEIYYSDALGSIDQVIEQMAMGGNIIGGSSGEKWASYGSADMTALNMMYVFKSTDEILSFNNSALWEEMKADMAKNGNITMICMNWASAPRCVMSVKPVNSVADLDKLILRVPSATYGAFFGELGCATTSMTFSEIYSAMQTGVIEAAEAPLSTLYTYSLQEVAKNLFMTEHSYASCCWGMSTDIWNLISADDQKVIVDEFTAGGKNFTQANIDTYGDYLNKMKEAGVTIVYPSDADKAAMTKAASAAFGQFPDLSDGLLDRIEEACKG